MKKVLIAVFMFSLMNLVSAQMHGGGNFNPADFDSVTVTGTAIVVNSTNFPIYYLDEDGDGEADYHLNFGPYWYAPDSSDAARPENGDNITILGALRDGVGMMQSTIIVFEINGEFWRDPFFEDWNGMGGGCHSGGFMGGGFGWNHDSLTTVALSGAALVDTTFFMNRYFLDTDNDGMPDYLLNFGPYWYEPESGAVRPSDGDQIDIIGGQWNSDETEPMIIVYELNGLVWRDSSSFGDYFGGGWIHGDMMGQQTFHSPFDDDDNMTVYSGWNHSGHMGGGYDYPDSLFCRIFEVSPENIPDAGGMNIFAGYAIDILKPDGNSWMGGNMMGGHVNFGNDVDYSLHYSDLQLDMYSADEDMLEVKYWDSESNDWVSVNAAIDLDNNTVSFSSSDVTGVVVLSASKITAVQKDDAVPSKFTLSRNYPNPFNPSTKIEFTLASDSHVILSIYNVVGEKVAELANDYKTAGSYTVTFNAENLSSGVYFYELRAGSFTEVRKMNLLK